MIDLTKPAIRFADKMPIEQTYFFLVFNVKPGERYMCPAILIERCLPMQIHTRLKIFWQNGSSEVYRSSDDEIAGWLPMFEENCFSITIEHIKI